MSIIYVKYCVGVWKNLTNFFKREINTFNPNNFDFVKVIEIRVVQCVCHLFKPRI